MPHDVFVSYSSPNREVAEAACAALEGRGMKCWIAPRDVTAGESWSGEIVEAIARAKLMVLVFSSQANASKHVLREVERAVHHGIPIIPLRIEKVRPTKELEYFLSVKHWLEAESRPIDPHLDRLAETIQDLLTRGPRSTSAPAAGAPPSPSQPTPCEPHPTTPPTNQMPVWQRRDVLAGLALGTVGLGAGAVAWKNWSWLTGGQPSPLPIPPPVPYPNPSDDDHKKVAPTSQKEGEVPVGPSAEKIDLLAKIDEQRDARQGVILRRGTSVILRGKSAQDSAVSLVVPWQPPVSYRLHLRIGRVREGEGSIVLGLASGEHKFVLLFDTGKEGELRTGLPGDRKGDWIESTVTRRYLVPKPSSAAKGAPSTLVDLEVTVQPDLIELVVNNAAFPGPKRRGKDWVVFSHRGAVSELKRAGRQRPSPIFLSCPKGLVLEKLLLEPLAGDPGKPLKNTDKPTE